MAILPEKGSDDEVKLLNDLNAACEAVRAVDRQARACRDVRDALIAELRLRGWSLRQVAEVTHLSSATISQIDGLQGLVSVRPPRMARES